MKKNLAVVVILYSLFFFQKDSYGSSCFNDKSSLSYIINADSTLLPLCISKLNQPGSKGIRSFNGGLQFQKIYKLKNGTILYAFRADASIGCNINEPVSTKYYNDSCKLIAKFPLKFSIKQGFKPFIATGFEPEDFEESKKGDYAIYFAELEKRKQEKQTFNLVIDPLKTKKSYVINKVEDEVLKFKIGDAIKADKQKGLQHYRNGKLINTFKIIPQLTIVKTQSQCQVAPCPVIETKFIVYYLESAKRFVNFKINTLLTSVNTYENPNNPNGPMNIAWKISYELKNKL